MKKKSIGSVSLHHVFYIFITSIIVAASVFSFSMYRNSSASGPELRIQVSDSPCGSNAGGEAITTGGGSGYATVATGDDPDCARAYLSGISETTDFRIGIQLSDNPHGPGCGQEIGGINYSPWASDGGGSTGWATDSNAYDPNCAEVFLETRSAPSGVSITNPRVEIQASDRACSAELGGASSTPSGGGWSNWVADGNSYDFDCLRLNLLADLVPLGKVTVLTQAFDSAGNAISFTPSVSWTMSGPAGAPNCNGVSSTGQTCDRMPFGSYTVSPSTNSVQSGGKTYQFSAVSVSSTQTLGPTSPPAGQCASGQSKPHFETSGSQCTSVNSCGVSSCTTGGGGGGPDVPPGQQLNFLPKDNSIFAKIGDFIRNITPTAFALIRNVCNPEDSANCEPEDTGGPLPTPPPPPPPAPPTQIYFTIQYQEVATVTASCSVSPASPMASGTNPSITFTTNSASNYCYVRNDNLPSPGNAALSGSNFPSVSSQPFQFPNGTTATYTPGSITYPGGDSSDPTKHNGSIYCQTTPGTTITSPNSGWQYCRYDVSAGFPVTVTHGVGGTAYIANTTSTSTTTTGSPVSFTVTPDSTHTIAPNVSFSPSNCSSLPPGFSGNNYTTGTISNPAPSASCNFNFNFTANTCSNGATNPTACTTCPTGQTMIGGQCSTVTVSVSATTPYNVSPSTNIAFTYNASTNSGTTECQLLDFSHSALTAYQSSSPINFFAPTVNGSYSYYIQCKNASMSASTATSNQIIVNVVEQQPDLTASAPVSSTATTGVAQTYTSSISNDGDLSTGASFSYFFQKSTAAAGGGTITDLTSSTMGALSASGNSGSSATATSPSITFSPAGQYSVRVCADKSNSASAGTISESNEGNNCSSWTTVTVTDIPVPVTSISANPTSMVLPTNSTVLTWSATNNATSCTVPASPVTANWSGSKAPSGSQTISGLTAGTYTYSLFCANTGGNSATASVTVTVSNLSGPDLTAGTMTPTTATVGTPAHFSAPITNVGDRSTVNSFPYFFQGGTSLANVGDFPGSTMTALASGVSGDATMTYTFTSAGSYIGRVCADKTTSAGGGVITETDENNNCGAWATIIVSDISCPAGTNRGNPCTSSANSCGQKNSGTIACDGSCSATTPSDSSCSDGHGGGSCPRGWTPNPTYPKCKGPTGGICPAGYTGTYPNCVGPSGTGPCPTGYTPNSAYPNCKGPTGGICPMHYTGTYPNCTAQKVTTFIEK
jgi:hypothetical protein